MQVNMTEGNFSKVLESSSTLILYFKSDFCGPCMSQSKILNELSEKYSQTLTVAEVNSIARPDWAEAFAIRSMPTMILFKEGHYKSRMIGLQPLSKVETWLERNG